jgi:hypothetical protein
MIIDPYATLATRAYNVQKIRGEVAAAAVSDGVREGIYYIHKADRTEGKQTAGEAVTKFTHPLLFNVPGTNDPLVAIDVRSFAGEGSYTKEVRGVLETRARLTLHSAIEKSTQDLYHPVAHLAFTEILTGVVASNFGVDPTMRNHIRIVAAAHYYNITHPVTPGGVYDDTERLMLAKDLVQTIKSPAETTDDVLGMLTTGDDIETFIENIKKVDGTDRTRRLNTGLISGGSSQLWYGGNVVELMSVAYEHAPTFCALLTHALGKGGYSRSEFARSLKYSSLIRDRSEKFLAIMRTIEQEFEHA